MMDAHGKRVLVVGLARSGRAVARVLAQKGARVTVTDLRPPASFPTEVRELTSLKIGVELGLHREATFLNQDLIVVSPGVPWNLAHLVAARKRNIPVLPEIEVASWYLPGQLVGVTDSNGKTTTTTLLGKMLEASSLPAFVGGNIGVPLSSAVEHAKGESLVVVELSSFQLEAIQSFHPNVAVLLNLSPNHLDRHSSFEAYGGAKSRIFHNQTPEDYAILNADDPNVMSLAPAIVSRKIFFSRRQNLPDGVFASNGHVLYRVGNLERVLLERSDVRLRGDFNVEDVLAACAAACVVGGDFDAVRRAVREFKGVEHRLEFVREIHRVEFYNDSKATSVDATAKALTAFDHGVHLILGGKDKGAPYTPLLPLLKDRAREVLLIGAAAEKIAADLGGAVEIVRAGDLGSAVRHAFKCAAPGDVVLLAPACASYDQFQDFEHRGRVFKELVECLAAETAVADSVKQVEIVNPEPAPKIHAAPPKAEPESKPATPQTPAGVAPPFATDGEPHAAARLPEWSPAPPPKQMAAPQEEMPQPAVSATPVAADSASLEVTPGHGEPLPADTETPGKAGEEREAATAPPLPVSAQEPKAPSLELIYVYEVAAEEVAPLVDEPSTQSRDEGDEQMTSDSLGEPEPVSDEPLPFEVPGRAGTGPLMSEATAQRRRKSLSPDAMIEQPSLFEHSEGPQQKSRT